MTFCIVPVLTMWSSLQTTLTRRYSSWVTLEGKTTVYQLLKQQNIAFDSWKSSGSLDIHTSAA